MKRGSETEITELKKGMDFRLPQFRREVFHRFYEFHLKHKTHPGLVYLAIPYLRTALSWSEEETLWFCFLNGNTQNVLTSFIIKQHFPSVQSAQPSKLEKFVNANWERLEFDTDRRHFKQHLVSCVTQYREFLRGQTQRAFFDSASWTVSETPGSKFMRLWAYLQTNLKYFGRLSVFSYMEYLRIAGLPIDCPTLFLFDLAGSKSHRNGLCKVLGRDDLDWHDSNPSFTGNYERGMLAELEQEGGLLLAEAQARAKGRPWEADVGYFTMESALCTFKSWHRPNRRYPNVYADMLLGRIERAEKRWPDVDLRIFREMRGQLPQALRLELNPGDPGVKPEKQNHYLTTGQVIMMDGEWPCFENDFNNAVRARQA